MKSKERLDLLLVNKGFFTSREKARRYIMTGDVLVDDVPIDKPGTKVDLTAAIRLR
ncbi:S4 domain protein, partial [Anaerococcus hydrogenalis]